MSVLPTLPIRAAVRVIRFHFYAAQHVLKAALESGLWWSGEAGLDLVAAGESLQALAALLPEHQWRVYTAAWRRLHGCLQRYDACVHGPQDGGPSRQVTDHAYGHHLISRHIEIEFALMANCRCAPGPGAGPALISVRASGDRLLA